MADRRTNVLRWTAVAVAVIGLGSYLIVELLDRPARPPGARLTVTATRPDGGAPSRDELEQTRERLRDRLESAGLDGADVDLSDGANLVLRADAPATTEMLQGLTASGRVRFHAARPISPNASPVKVELPAEGETPAGRQAVVDKLGPAYAEAAAVESTGGAAALQPATLDAFAALTPDEVAVLPVRIRALIPSIDCEQLRARGPRIEVRPDQPDVLCDDTTKYLLEPAAATGGDVATAEPKLIHSRWGVEIAFTGEGQNRITALTGELAPTQGQVAIVLDTTVVSAPTVQQAITGNVEIQGDFTRDEAAVLAAQLDGGELSLRLTAAA
jgi:preprotein translocase subunit SecD